jgi:hypothetical protein
LSKADWSWGWFSAIDFNGRTIWIADAHVTTESVFVARADEKVTAFLELERVTGESIMDTTQAVIHSARRSSSSS